MREYDPQLNQVKSCTSCGEEKQGVEFYVQKGNLDGLMGSCKECWKLKHKTKSYPPNLALLEKKCKGCSETFSIDYFFIDCKVPTGYSSKCKVCSYANEEARLTRRLTKHNVTKEQYNYLLEIQDQRCALCLVPANELPLSPIRAMAIDHDHSCCPGSRSCGNCIRGLLCSNCNLALGGFKDNITALMRAVQYLQSSLIDFSNQSNE